MTKQNRSIAIYAAIIFAMLMIAYANHFNNGFHFDDWHAVVNNVHIQSLKNIPKFFYDPTMFSDSPQHWGIRALVTTSLAIDYWFGGGLAPAAFQIDTFIWFIVLGVLLYFLYKKLLASVGNNQWIPYIALGATAIYILHTANAETVNYIIARSDVQSTLCIVASFLIYLAYPAKRKWGLYLIPAVIGVFAKETVLVLVILLFFYDLLFEKRLNLFDVFKKTNFKKLIGALLTILPLLLAVGAVQVYTLSKTPGIPGISNPLFYYLLTQSYVWVHYFIAFFLPLNLSADTDWTVIYNPFDERIIIGMIFVIFLVIVIFRTSRKSEQKPIAFGLIWFAAALLPTSLAPFAEITNDHRMFFPFIGLALSVATALGLWLKQHQTLLAKYKTPFIAGVFIVLSLHVYGIHQRNKVWYNDESLWLDVTQKSPQNGRGLMNYGLTQMSKGNYDVANTYFTKAQILLPNYNLLYINLGVLNGALKKPVEAEENFKRAINLSPGEFDAYAYYAAYLQRENRFAEAKPLAEKALQINPTSVMTLATLMSIYNGLGEWDNLDKTTSKALTLTPGDSTTKQYAQAAKTHTPLVQLSRQQKNQALTASDHLNLSVSYYNQKAYDKCLAECEEVLKLSPNNADAYSNMGAAYNELKQWDKAIDACTKALQINPNHKLAQGNLNWAKTKVR